MPTITSHPEEFFGKGEGVIIGDAGEYESIFLVNIYYYFAFSLTGNLGAI